METRSALGGRGKEEASLMPPVGSASADQSRSQSQSQMDADAKGGIGKRMQAKLDEETGKREDSDETKRAREDADADDDEKDEEADNVIGFRKYWNFLWSESFGNYEDITEIPSMRHTENVPEFACCRPAMQVFSIKLKEIKRGLEWPLQVFGHVAMRDHEDNKRNIIFIRDRDNCQTLTAKDPYLILTGPSRAVVDENSIACEVELKVKGTTHHEDRILSSIVYEVDCILNSLKYGKLQRETRSNKHSTVDFTFAYLRTTVEATVEAKVVMGSFGNLRPRLFACTKSLPKTQFVLLDPREGAMVISDSGMIKMTRSVVSVEIKGGLKLTLEARSDEGKAIAAKGTATFVPLEFGRSEETIDLGFCKVLVTVAWSQFSW